MKPKTKLIIGISLLASAVATTITFIALLVKKKSAWKAFLALTVVEGVAGIVFLQDRIFPQLPFNKKKAEKEEEDDSEEEVEELFDEEDVDQARSTLNAELAHTGDDESANAAPRLNNEVPRDDEASEEDFQ